MPKTTAATLAERLEANATRQEEIRGRLSELDEAIDANEAERGAVTAKDGDASTLRAEGRALEDEATDLRNALAHLEGEAVRLEANRAEAEAAEAEAAYEAAKMEADAAMGELRDRLAGFVEGTLLPAAGELDKRLEAMRQAWVQVHALNPDKSRYDARHKRDVAFLWSDHAPLEPMLRELRAFGAGKPIVRTPGVPSQEAPAEGDAETSLAFR